MTNKKKMEENSPAITNKPATTETLARILQAAINDDVILSDADKRIYERLIAADALLKDFSYKNNEARANALREKFGIALRTARNDIAKSAELFNNLDATDVRTMARILLSQADQLLTMVLECKGKGYFKDAVSLLKLKKEICADLCKGSQLDPQLLQQNNYYFSTGKEAAKSLNLEEGLSKDDILNMLRQYNVSKEDEEKIMAEAHIVDYAELLPERAPDEGTPD